MRVAFLGNHAWSVPPLRAVGGAADIEIELVVTNPPRPAGRGSELTATAVEETARELDLPLLEVDGVRGGQGFRALDELEPDALVVVAYGEILPPDVLDIPRLGSVNVHFSLLPRWRGAAPVQRAILEGDEITGVTVMLMDEGMDTGPILATEETTIGAEEDAGSLGARLAALGGPVLVRTLRAVDGGSIEPRSQDHTVATYAPKLLPDERTIDWSATSDAIVRRVRAFAPEPGAGTTFRRGRLKVLAASDLGMPGGWIPEAPPMPSRIMVSPDGRVSVDAGRASAVELLEVAPAGRRRMPASAWARGARIEPHEHLG
jgi:methionyl-tRNA formyltransferase